MTPLIAHSSPHIEHVSPPLPLTSCIDLAPSETVAESIIFPEICFDHIPVCFDLVRGPVSDHLRRTVNGTGVVPIIFCIAFLTVASFANVAVVDQPSVAIHVPPDSSIAPSVHAFLTAAAASTSMKCPITSSGFTSIIACTWADTSVAPGSNSWSVVIVPPLPSKMSVKTVIRPVR